METRSNILVVDDNPDKLQLLEAALRMAGYHVNTATDGEEALAFVTSFQPDLIITDVMMPRMNGYELAEKIRGREHLETLDACYDLAGNLARENKIPEAERLVRRAAESARKTLGPNHPATQKYQTFLTQIETKKAL